MGLDDLKEETKLKLLAALKNASGPISTLKWAELAQVNRATVYRYMPLMEREGWLNSKPGPGRTILYSVKPNRAVLPVDQIPKDAKPTKAVPKKDIPAILANLLSEGNDKPLITKSTLATGVLGKTIAVLYGEVGRARSGEMANKDNLSAARERLSSMQKAVEKFLTVLNGMLLTPELWDPRTINEFLSLNADSIQLAQWAESIDDTSDLLIKILTDLTQGNYVATESSITFET